MSEAGKRQHHTVQSREGAHRRSQVVTIEPFDEVCRERDQIGFRHVRCRSSSCTQTTNRGYCRACESRCGTTGGMQKATTHVVAFSAHAPRSTALSWSSPLSMLQSRRGPTQSNRQQGIDVTAFAACISTREAYITAKIQEKRTQRGGEAHEDEDGERRSKIHCRRKRNPLVESEHQRHSEKSEG